MLKCVKSFLTNKYPVIIIESENGGGKVILFSILLQIIQPIIENRDYSAFRITQISKRYLRKKYFSRNINNYDCSEINSFLDFNKFYEDDYGDTSSNKISHNRTSTYDALSKYYRLALKEFREEIKNNENLKKPTDIQ